MGLMFPAICLRGFSSFSECSSAFYSPLGTIQQSLALETATDLSVLLLSYLGPAELFHHFRHHTIKYRLIAGKVKLALPLNKFIV